MCSNSTYISWSRARQPTACTGPDPAAVAGLAVRRHALSVSVQRAQLCGYGHLWGQTQRVLVSVLVQTASASGEATEPLVMKVSALVSAQSHMPLCRICAPADAAAMVASACIILSDISKLDAPGDGALMRPVGIWPPSAPGGHLLPQTLKLSNLQTLASCRHMCPAQACLRSASEPDPRALRRVRVKSGGTHRGRRHGGQ